MWILINRWYISIISPHPPPKAQGTLKKRKEKECNIQRLGRSVVTCCPLDMTWLCTHKIKTTLINYTRSSQLKIPAWLEERLMSHHFCLWSHCSWKLLGKEESVFFRDEATGNFSMPQYNIHAHMDSINWIQWFKNKQIMRRTEMWWRFLRVDEGLS